LSTKTNTGSDAGSGERRDRADVGAYGEDVAAAFLREEGFKILYRNYRAPTGGEADLVARHVDVLVFLEVKTRVGDPDQIRPSDAVTPLKERLVSRGAASWLGMLDHPVPFRFDIVEVVLQDGRPPFVHRCENAFQMPEDYYE